MSLLFERKEFVFYISSQNLSCVIAVHAITFLGFSCFSCFFFFSFRIINIKCIFRVNCKRFAPCVVLCIHRHYYKANIYYIATDTSGMYVFLVYLFISCVIKYQKQFCDYIGISFSFYLFSWVS